MKQSSHFNELRREMVERQLIRRGIDDLRVLAALGKVPRHFFVADNLQKFAYSDQPLPINCRQTISQPYMVALMTEALELAEEDSVLEIGTGSGYQTAILSNICQKVFTVERYAELMESAAEVLRLLGYTNIKMKVGDGTRGWPEHRPFNAIIITAGAPHVPAPLIEQLADGGRLVIPVGGTTSQELLKLTRNRKTITQKSLGGCRFVPLCGEFGWQ